MWRPPPDVGVSCVCGVPPAPTPPQGSKPAQHTDIMAKMKKGKAHHWFKEEKDKVAKKSYVPTGQSREVR